MIFRIFMVYLNIHFYFIKVNWERVFKHFQTRSPTLSEATLIAFKILEPLNLCYKATLVRCYLHSSTGWLPDEDQLIPCECGLQWQPAWPSCRKALVGRPGQDAWLESVLELPQSDLWEDRSVTPRRKKKSKETDPSLEIAWAHAHCSLSQCPNYWVWGRWVAQGHTTGTRTKIGTHAYTVLFPRLPLHHPAPEIQPYFILWNTVGVFPSPPQ